MVDFADKDSHDAEAENYVLSNFAPIIKYAISNMKAKGRIPANTEDGDVYEAGVRGLMHALKSYDPKKGKLSTHMINRIQGQIGDLLQPTDVAAGDVAAANRYSKKSGGNVEQQMYLKQPSGRVLSETFGGSMGDEGQQATSGASVHQSGAASLSQKMTPEFKANLERLTARHEKKQEAKQKQQVPVENVPLKSPEPVDKEPAALGEVKQAPSGKKIMVRRAADIAQHNPEVHERLKAVNAAKTGQGGQNESN